MDEVNNNITPFLEVIDYKNRFWLFIITIPFLFAFFIITFLIYFGIVIKITGNHESLFLVNGIIFYIEIILFIRFMSKFRFIPNGKLYIYSDGLLFIYKHKETKYLWNKIGKIKIFYRGDDFWKAYFKIFKNIKGKNRYRHLHYTSPKELNEKILDKIEINDLHYYIKIRNENEKNIFMSITNLAKLNGVHVIEEKDDGSLYWHGNETLRNKLKK